MVELLHVFVETFLNKTGQKTYENWRKKKYDEGLEILKEFLLAEFKTGKAPTTLLEQEEFFRALLRFERAINEGVANKNLRLMAQIIKGTMLRDETIADRCLYLQSIVAEMTEEEVMLATKLFLNSKKMEENKSDKDTSAHQLTQDEVIPVYYPTKAALNAALARLTRTGLVIPISAWGGLIYNSSPLMEELNNLCDLQVFDNIQPS